MTFKNTINFSMNSRPVRAFTAMTFLVMAMVESSAVYANNDDNLKLKLSPVDKFTQSIEFETFDGSTVNGQVKFPKAMADSYPIMLAMHGMMRSHHRNWDGNYKGNPTVENTHRVVEAALNAGFAVIALDARYHGVRKDPAKPVQQILKQLHGGESDNYLDMISSTVKDYQQLLKLLKQQPQFATNEVSVTGYSMGAQMAILLASANKEVNQVVAMVPPHINHDLPQVSPAEQAAKIDSARVLLLTSNHDQYSTEAQNADLFNKISSENKTRLVFNSDHILPSTYVEFIPQWLDSDE